MRKELPWSKPDVQMALIINSSSLEVAFLCFRFVKKEK